jgi:hypothetical protein
MSGLGTREKLIDIYEKGKVRSRSVTAFEVLRIKSDIYISTLTRTRKGKRKRKHSRETK